MWKIAHRLPGIGIKYHGKIAISKNTSSPVNIFPKRRRARLNGFANSSTSVRMKFIGARYIPVSYTHLTLPTKRIV